MFPGHYTGENSGTGAVRMRVILMLTLQPATLETAESNGESLAEIGGRIQKAMTIDTDDVLILSIEQSIYREEEFKNPTAVLGMEHLMPLVERVIRKHLGETDEPWKGDATGLDD